MVNYVVAHNISNVHAQYFPHDFDVKISILVWSKIEYNHKVWG